VFSYKDLQRLLQTAETVETMQGEVARLAKDFEEFKQHVRSEIAEIRETVSKRLTVAPVAAHQGENRRNDDEDDRWREEVEKNLTAISAQMSTVLQTTTDLKQWSATVKPEFENINEQIVDARKDIKAKITYGLSRLKT